MKVVDVELLKLCIELNVHDSNIPCIDLEEHDKQVRANAIDEFVQKYKSETEECDIGYDCYNCSYHSCTEGAKYVIVEKIAEQLKEQAI